MTKTASQTTQEFVPIQAIRDGVVVLKTGGLRLVLIVSSINFALKSEDEQTAILLQFQNFLNSLDFHVQLFVESRRLDIRPYLRTLEERLVAQTNDLMKVQTREYIEFIKKFTETTDIMSKSFFVVIPYAPALIQVGKRGGLLSRVMGGKRTAAEVKTDDQAEFEEQRTQLEQRGSVIEQGFARLGLRVLQLGTEELVELYFKIFNPGETDIPSI